MKSFKKISFIVLARSLVVLSIFSNSCGIYKFHDISIPTDIKTIKINFIENRAQYVNPQLSPQLTDKVQQKIINQTRLSQVSGDNADWEISGYITNYSLSTSAISSQQAATNRLTIGVHITKNDHKEDKVSEYDVSRSFEFPASQSLQQAEANFYTVWIQNLTDEIFNKLFSNW